MSARAAELADRFRAANGALIRFLLEASPAELERVALGEQRSCLLVAHHVAFAHLHILDRVRAFAEGTPVPPREPERFAAINAEVARRNHGVDRRAVVDLLRSNGAEVADYLAGLTDEQLDRVDLEGPGQEPLRTWRVIELRCIGHIEGHLETLGRP